MDKVITGNLRFALKIIFSGCLITILLVKFDLGNIKNKLISVELFWLTIVFFLPHIGILISTIKWKILLDSQGVHEPIWKLFEIYLVGTFFNNFMPGMIGGDIYRIAHLSSMYKQEAPSITAATFMERFIGVTALISLFIPICFLKTFLDVYPWIGLFGGIVLILYLLILLFILNNTAHRVLVRFIKISYLKPVVKYIELSHRQIHHYKSYFIIIFTSYLLSIAFYIISILTVYSAALSVGISIELYKVAIIVILVLLIGMVPISLNGLGLNESAYVFFFSLFGIQNADSLSVAILLRARILFTGLLGGLIFAFQHGNQPLRRKVLKHTAE